MSSPRRLQWLGRLQWLAGLLLLTLAGCASQDCDPSRAGLLDGIGCSASGGFQQRQVALGHNLAATRAEALEAQANAARAAAVRDDAERDLAAKRRRLGQLDSQISELRRQLAMAQGRVGVDQAALRQAQEALAELQRERGGLTPQSDDAALRRADERRAAIARILRQM